jgi:hypothetical protein
MITKEQILQATEYDLCKLAGEVLPQKHVFQDGIHPSATCLFCRGERDTVYFEESCSENNEEIRVDWPEAMKWRDWCNQKFKRSLFEDAMYAVFQSTAYHDVFGFCTWLISDKCRPKHYLKASAICKLEQESNK